MPMNDADYMQEAICLAETALSENEFPVGCVIAYGNEILAKGSRKNSRGLCVNEIDHAEITALRQLSGQHKTVDKSRIRLYCTMEPCLMCLGAILVSGIRHIVYAYEDVMGGATSFDLSGLSPLYSRDPVQIVPHVLREKSLGLFKAFFKNPENDYWRNSLLARYTLEQ
jgi:tRNA(adenine34) deaminase